MWKVVELRQQLPGDYKDKFPLSKHLFMVNNDCDFYQNYEIYTTVLILRDFCEVNF